MDLIEIEGQLKTKVDDHLTSKIQDSISSAWNRASEIGFDCDLYQVLSRSHPEFKQKGTLQREKVFLVGRTLETPIIRLLQDSGIEVKDRIDMYEWPEVKIRGRLDSWVTVPGIEGMIPLEVKTASPNMFRIVKATKDKGESLLDAKQFWLTKYPGQLQTYMLLKGSEFGIWFFYDKSSGDYFFWIVELDLEYAESILKRAERVNGYCESGTVPAPAYKSLCLGCDFAQTYCFPAKDYGEGVELIDDPRIEAQCSRLLHLEADLAEPTAEYDQIKKELIGSKAKPGFLYGKNVIVGTSFQIISTERKHTSYDIPKELKDQFKRESPYFITEIERLGENQE